MTVGLTGTAPVGRGIGTGEVLLAIHGRTSLGRKASRSPSGLASRWRMRGAAALRTANSGGAGAAPPLLVKSEDSDRVGRAATQAGPEQSEHADRHGGERHDQRRPDPGLVAEPLARLG